MKSIIKYKDTEKIIFAIKEGYSFNETLARELKKKSHSLIVMLQRLEKRGFIKAVRNKQFNMKIYSLTDKGKLLYNYFKDLHKFEEKYKQVIKWIKKD